MLRAVLIVVGLASTGLALLGAVLPGLPTTPFVLVALWAFARSSDRLARWLERVPLLRQALVEAHRFERRGAVRPAVKVTAVAFAWGSVIMIWLAFGLSRPWLIGGVAAAAVAATLFMALIPTDTEPLPATSPDRSGEPRA